MLIDFILMNAVDVPLWIETEGAVQHVKDYIIHYKLSPPSASSSSMNDQDSDEEENDEDDDAVVANDDSGDNQDSEKRKRYEKEDNEEDNSAEESDLEMFIGMFETAIEMAAADDAK